MPNSQLPKQDKFAVFQKAAFGLAISFYIVSKVFLKDADIKAALGIAYPWYLMVVTLVWLTCAGFSGKFLLDFFDKIKTIYSKKAEDE